MKRIKPIQILDVIIVFAVMLILSSVDSLQTHQILIFLIPTMIISLVYCLKRGAFDEYKEDKQRKRV